MEIGKVYKNLQDTSVLRTIIVKEASNILMMDVSYDASRDTEYQIEQGNGDFHVTVGGFAAVWQEVENVDLKAEVNAIMAPKYA
jgi:hypothetical protein